MNQPSTVAIDRELLTEIIDFRRELHQIPELSGREHVTAARVADQLKRYSPACLIQNIGGYGIMAIFESMEPGPTVIFRAELDAVDIGSDQAHGNLVTHACGHDGHMAILAGFGAMLFRNPLPKGRIALLFQPAEETGQGAPAVLNDPLFQKNQPDFMFALHNLPGFPLGTILIKDSVFASASTGVVIKLSGATSHASEPLKGSRIAQAVAELVQELEFTHTAANLSNPNQMITVVHINAGTMAFGSTPGRAVVMATIRATTGTELETMKQKASDIVFRVSQKYRIDAEIGYTEHFPSVANHPEAVDYVKQAAAKSSLPVTALPAAFPWSEDFGHFAEKYKCAMFGLGAGIDCPGLHHNDYLFPDLLIETGISMFYNLAQLIVSRA